MLDPTTLASAIAHLRDFRATLYDGDEVDAGSHLRAADLDVVLAAAELQLRSEGSASSGELEASDHGQN